MISFLKKTILFLFFPITLFAKDWDSIPRVMFKASIPAFLNGNVELGGMVEYKFFATRSIEFGGSYITPFNGKGMGFTFKTDYRIYNSKGFYQSPLLFVRYQYFKNRTYQWNNQNDEPSRIIEESDLYYIGEHDRKRTANEKKIVFGFEYLFGKEFVLLRNITLDLYSGGGCHWKVRRLDILSENYVDSPTALTYYNPTKQIIINSFYPTIHAGFRIGIARKTKQSKFLKKVFNV
jgi:hypothetical protein